MCPKDGTAPAAASASTAPSGPSTPGTSGATVMVTRWPRATRATSRTRSAEPSIISVGVLGAAPGAGQERALEVDPGELAGLAQLGEQRGALEQGLAARL